MPRKKTATASPSPSRSTASSEQLDFSSTEFNHIDELDDNTGNFRTFHSLSGIVTADMRHQEQRRQTSSKTAEPVLEMEEKVDQEGGSDKVRTVLEEIETALPPPLTVVSTGRLLIIDGDLERALRCAERLSQGGLDCTLCTPSHGRGGFSVTNIDAFTFIEADALAISGAFGGFVPMVRTADGTTKKLSSIAGQLSSATGRKNAGFDLVLDLQPVPSFAGEQLPVGYYAPGDDPLLLEAALAELPEMRGRFKKPQFVVMAAGRCLHGWRRLDSCRQCIDICPVAALTSEDGMVVVDQHRCQGCGACALVCPTGAMQVPGPRRELLARLEQVLCHSINRGEGTIHLIFHDMHGLETEPAAVDKTGCRELFFAVDELAFIGADILLASLAYGAAAVTVVCDQNSDGVITEALRQQMRLGAAIVEGVGLPKESLWFAERLDEVANIPRSAGPVMAAPADFTLDHDKRTLTRLAAGHLMAQHGGRQSVTGLPSGAPYGTIAVTSSCSLCMACVGACPAGALVADGDTPKLTQIESRCHQCGACRTACPENCISLMPRLLCDTEAVDAPRLVHEVEPFACIACGEPFASVTMVSKMQEKLARHWMYCSSQQQKRLQMCRTCRTRDFFNAGDYQS